MIAIDLLFIPSPTDANLAPFTWTAGWMLAAVATCWNLVKDTDGLMATIRDSDSQPAVLASAWWFFRQDAHKLLACLLMVFGGLVATFRGPPEATRFCILMASGVICVNQVWNMADRWRIAWFIRRDHARQMERERHGEPLA